MYAEPWIICCRGQRDTYKPLIQDSEICHSFNEICQHGRAFYNKLILVGDSLIFIQVITFT